MKREKVDEFRLLGKFRGILRTQSTCRLKQNNFRLVYVITVLGANVDDLFRSGIAVAYFTEKNTSLIRMVQASFPYVVDITPRSGSLCT